MISKYIKKPIEIEALQWTIDNEKEMASFIGQPLEHNGNGAIVISTLEGRMLCPAESYVIKGPFGEFYPCKKEVFEETYVKV